MVISGNSELYRKCSAMYRSCTGSHSFITSVGTMGTNGVAGLYSMYYFIHSKAFFKINVVESDNVYKPQTMHLNRKITTESA